METLALRDGDILPTQEVLEAVLGSSYPAFEELNALLISMEIRPEWNYYRDGKAWLCKMMFKKKNMGWLHVYDGFFRVSFFSGKTLICYCRSEYIRLYKRRFL